MSHWVTEATQQLLTSGLQGLHIHGVLYWNAGGPFALRWSYLTLQCLFWLDWSKGLTSVRGRHALPYSGDRLFVGYRTPIWNSRVDSKFNSIDEPLHLEWTSEML